MRAQLEVAAAAAARAATLPRDLLADVAGCPAWWRTCCCWPARDADAPVPTAPEPLEVGALLAEVAARREPRGRPGDGVRARRCWSRADAAELRRVVRNLVDNAVRHARPRGPAGVPAGRGTVLLTVTDDGPGHPAGRPRAGLRAVHPARRRPQPGRGRFRPGAGHRRASWSARAGGRRAPRADAPGGGLRAVVALPGGATPARATVTPVTAAVRWLRTVGAWHSCPLVC